MYEFSFDIVLESILLPDYSKIWSHNLKLFWHVVDGIYSQDSPTVCA